MSNHPLEKSLADCLAAVSQLTCGQSLVFMEGVADLLATTFRSRGKVLLAGNGGSLCDAAHFAEELTGCFRAPRAPLPAVVLNDPGHITCTANDFGFDEIFSRSIEALGQPGDVFIGLSTSGNSPNIIRAFHQAKAGGLYTVAFLGKEGGELKGFADHELLIRGFSTSDRIQEAHMAAIHLIIERIEQLLFAPIPTT